MFEIFLVVGVAVFKILILKILLNIFRSHLKRKPKLVITIDMRKPKYHPYVGHKYNIRFNTTLIIISSYLTLVHQCCT